MPKHPSDSSPQRQAGIALVKALKEELDIVLELDFRPPNTCGFEVDGFSAKPPVLCEAWAHYGEVKPPHKHKIISDAFKLLLAEKQLKKKHEKFIIFCDNVARESFVSDN